ncbi:MAG TPA: energy-coupling factor transporter transmembrane component T [Nevskiaceae bacterium]|nr:energy-coupling factor transporter transmembrane component T [Nevskiaceae bacterium]
MVDTPVPAADPREKLKLVYVLGLAIALFALSRPDVLVALLALQVVLWFVSRLPAVALWRSTRRLGVFLFLIALSFAFVGTGAQNDQWIHVPVARWSVPVNLSGLFLAVLMGLRVVTLVIASAWLQRSCAPGALVRGMRALRVPDVVAITVDATLSILGGDRPMRGGGRGDGSGRGGGGGGGHGGGRRHADPSAESVGWSEIRGGQSGAVSRLLERGLDRAQRWLSEHYPEMDAAQLRDFSIALALCLAVIGTKALQVLPGIPFASGHKNIIVVPLLLYAAHATRMRFGGFAVGTAVGVVSFLLGYGKYGILEVAHFALPGLLADLLMPLVRAQSRALRLAQFAAVGIVLGIGRFAANFLAILLAGAPDVAFVLFAPLLVSQVAFGALSCFVSVAIIRPENPEPKTNEQTYAR